MIKNWYIIKHKDAKDDEKEVTMLGCHSFCTECITLWLEEHNDTFCET